MENRAVEASRQGLREVATPFNREAVFAQRLVLGHELRSLVGVDGQSEAACPTEGVAGQLLEPVEIVLGQHPEGAGPLGAELSAREVVRWRTATQGEAAVPPASPAGELPRLEQPHALACLGEPVRAGATRHATPHDRHVDRSRRPVDRRHER
jgi:hypothetical protein